MRSVTAELVARPVSCLTRLAAVLRARTGTGKLSEVTCHTFPSIPTGAGCITDAGEGMEVMT